MPARIALPDQPVIHLHKIEFADPRWDRQDFETDFEEGERSRAAAFVRPEHRRKFAIAHGFRRHVLAGYIGCAAATLRFGREPFGKPNLIYPNPDRSLKFNLSHTRNHAVLVVGRQAMLGVDIEEPAERRSIIEISQRYFSASERAALERGSAKERVDTFLRIWTRKEAILKATGHGLSLPLEQVSVSPVDQDPIILSLPRGCGDPREWSVKHLDFGKDCLGAVAVRQHGVTLDFIETFSSASSC